MFVNSNHTLKLVVWLLFGTVLLTPMLASAELIIYKGTRKDSIMAEGHNLVLNSKLILIVDYASSQSTVFLYSSVSGIKRYSSTQLTNAHFVDVLGKSGNYLAIAKSPDQCQIDSGVTGEGVYFKGRNANLKINKSSTASFPKIMSGQASGLGYSTNSGQPYLGEGTWKAVFDSSATIASNQDGETFDAAVARVTAQLESMGYSL
jgi:hypothetical protein